MPSYHTKQLAALCSEHPVTSKVILVPSAQAGVAMGTDLARCGTNWINLRFATPEDIAREISEPAFLADGWTPLPKDADMVELVPIVTDFLASPANIYFKNQPFSHGLLRSIHRTLRALRIAGTQPETLLKQRGSLKLRALAQLFVAYQDCMEAHRWFDGPDVFSVATSAIDPNAPRPGVYVILDETPLPGLAKEFVRRLAGPGIRRMGRSDYGASTPETVAGFGFSDVNLVSEETCQPAGQTLSRPSSEPISNLELRLSTGPEIELRNTFARILAEGWPFDSVEIACAAPDYLNYAYDAVRKNRLPSTFGSGVSILQTRPGQAIRAAYQVVASGGDPTWISALLDGKLLNVQPGKLGALPKPLHLLMSIAKQRGSTTAAKLARIGANLLSEHVSTLSESEEPARDSLVRRLDELAKHCSASGTSYAMAGALLEVIDNHKFEALTPKPGHLNIVPLDRAGFDGRAHLFVLGLDNTSFPGAPGEDPLLLDHERSRISGDLEMLRTRPTANTWHLIRILGLTPHAILSASVYRLADGQESEPASLFHHLKKRVLQQPVIEPILAKHTGASDYSSWTLTWARSGGDRLALQPRIPWLFSGEQADQERANLLFSRFKGMSGAQDGAVDPAADILSASRLETLTRCPYRYFWRYVLDIKPPSEERIDATKWLSPLDFGSLLHELYQKFMTEILERGQPPDLERDRTHLIGLLHDLINELSAKIPPPNPMAFEVDVTRLEAAADTFLAEESKRPAGQKPRGFEVSFGFKDDIGLNQPEAVTLKLGELTIRLRGLIDRVDETEGGYIIWDYKTGSAVPYDESDLIGGGMNLQWALYAHAFREILGSNAAGKNIWSGYYFASDREHGRKMLGVPPDHEELGQMLRPVLRLAEAGAFPPIQKTSQCMFCDYRPICEKDRMLPNSVTWVPDVDTEPQLIQLASEWLSN